MNAIRTLVFALCATCGAAGAAFAQDDSAWAEQKTTASDGTTNTYFGSAAAVLGATAAIGADGDDDFAGSVYLLTKTGGAWSEAQKVGADDRAGGDEFGYRVALADGLMVATAFSATVGANTSQGAAYVFVHDAGAWTQSQKLLADDGLQFDDFGSAVAIDGTRLLIGANGATVGANAAQGAAYVFTSDGATWMQAQKLVADDGVAFDNFGIAAAVAGDTAFVGAPSAQVDGNAGAGAVYVYSLAGGQWTQVQKLVASDGHAFGAFGMSLAYDGTTAIVGATGGTGAAYVFTNSGGSWIQAQKLVGDDTVSGDGFGNAVALSGTKLLVGSDIAAVDGNTSRGAAYLFSAGAAGWVQTHKFVASDGTTDDFFAASLALDGDTAILATPHPTIGIHSWQGAAYFYTRDTLFADGFDGATQ